MNKNKEQLLGAHVSIAGGLYNAIANGEKIGANAIQIFSKNQTRWLSKPLLEPDAIKFQQAWKNSSIKEIVIHDSYLINLGSPDSTILNKSRDAFLDETERAEMLGIRFLVFHPGSHINSGEKTGIKTIADSLNLMINKHPDYQLRLLLEATAGQGTNLGYKFEQLAEIINQVEDKTKVGVCLDTAHIFAAGYDLRTPETYDKTISEFDSIVGLENLFCFHINDSKKEYKSHVDRHQNIGEGFLGIEPFRRLLNDPRLTEIPKLLETPGDETDFQRNLDLLKSLIG